MKSLDAQALASELRKQLEGEVRFDNGSRALYATDSSNYRQVPIGVVVPRSADDVIATLSTCREFHAPVLSRGGGTSLAGQCCNVAVVLDFSKYMNRILEIDPEKKIARVQPGVVLDWLNEEAKKHKLWFAPDPSTHNRCTFGGMIGNNSCGVHSVQGGKTVDNVYTLDVVTYDGLRLIAGATDDAMLQARIKEGGRLGAIYRDLINLRDRYADLIRQNYPKIPRRVSGYNLDQLLPENGFNVARALVGTESTCVTVLEATLRLLDRPPARTLVVLGYPSVYEAADHITDILKFQPLGLEGVDQHLVDDMKKKKLHPENLKFLPEGHGFLLVEFGGEDKRESDAQGRAMMAALKTRPNAPSMKLYDDEQEESIVWKIRESGLGATARIPGSPDAWEGWEDSAVAPDRLGDYLRALRSLFDRYQYDGALYGHFGQGCVHTRISFDLKTQSGIEKFHSFLDEASSLVVSFGGSLSGEHGDGQSKADYLPKMFGPELMRAFREFKSIWDPEWRMNPGKVLDPYHVTDNLRLGADYHPRVLDTHFTFPDDHGSFAYATERCVGVGECRRRDGGVMCPSYMVTLEEKHSTRGRTHLLFEMLQGQELKKGWRSKEVKEALDLCLSCKGCKSDCPINVDMATYKSEFLSHYYKRRLRPRSAYAFGLIFWWARIASLWPRLVNWVTHAPVLSAIFKWLGGVHQEREIPKFADETFRHWFERRAIHNEGKQRVLLWPDTFNNHFTPQTSIAAVEVLEAAGYQVIIPKKPLCCGRPLYDYGMLTTAKKWLHQILEQLRDEIRLGTPLVGLEPSCVAVFRDELCNLMPNDEDAQRLKQQSFLLSEFLVERANYHPPRLEREAIVQAHCHHHAIFKTDSEKELLKRLGVKFDLLKSGCCGMAGGFGYETPHYDVSVACGERVLLPRVRETPDDTLVIADGFSCREQIEQLGERHALHVAEVAQMALRKQPTAESRQPTVQKEKPALHPLWILLLAFSCCLSAAAYFLITR